jgi:iron-sulfur cluster repair protein YtfE (RIC family)
MKNSVESLLAHDHEELGRLLAELDAKLEQLDVSEAFKVLDLFWARLAIHIRAENLHLFPALANTTATLFSGQGKLPTSEEAHDLLLRLRSDHDYFMKELATLIKAMREIALGQNRHDLEIQEIRSRLNAIRERLEVHNVLEEERAYTWPTVLFDEATLNRLGQRLKQELENLPPRFT